METLSTENNELLIEKAIEGNLPISFRYWSAEHARDEQEPDGITEPPPRRVVSPYELRDGKDGKTLLVCWSHGSEAVRCFDLERIGAVRSEASVEDFVHPVERN